jgi:hypothetical protein
MDILSSQGGGGEPGDRATELLDLEAALHDLGLAEQVVDLQRERRETISAALAIYQRMERSLDASRLARCGGLSAAADRYGRA